MSLVSRESPSNAEAPTHQPGPVKSEGRVRRISTDEEESGVQKRDATKINREAKEVNRIVNDILQFARMTVRISLGIPPAPTRASLEASRSLPIGDEASISRQIHSEVRVSQADRAQQDNLADLPADLPGYVEEPDVPPVAMANPAVVTPTDQTTASPTTLPPGPSPTNS